MAMKRVTASLALILSFSGCRPKEITLSEPAVVMESPVVHMNAELDLRLADVTKAREDYRKGGSYPYNNACGESTNLKAKEGSSILYVLDINPEEVVDMYSLTLDGRAMHSSWPYDHKEEVQNFPYTEMELLDLKKGNHTLAAEVKYKSGKSIKKSLDILIE